MPSPVVQQVVDQVTATDTVIDSAVTALNGVQALVAAAVQQALANGATAAELQPVTDALATLKSETDNLAQAVAANTPAAPVPVPGSTTAARPHPHPHPHPGKP